MREQVHRFHESKQFEADDQKVALVDIDETICFYKKKNDNSGYLVALQSLFR